MLILHQQRCKYYGYWCVVCVWLWFMQRNGLFTQTAEKNKERKTEKRTEKEEKDEERQEKRQWHFIFKLK